MSGIICVNGNFSDPDKAQITVLDRGFLFGDNVFETFVAFRDVILNPYEHLARLRQSAESINLAIPLSDEQLIFELESALQQVNTPKAYLRLVITRGCGMGLLPPKELVQNRVIYCFPAQEVPTRFYTSGIKLFRKRLPYTERGPSAKTGNYLRSIVGLQQAQSKGWDDLLWENSEGEITESSIANIFLIGREGDLADIVTPSVQSGLLPGITRTNLLQLLNNAGIKAEERIIYADELARYDEAFLCSTVRGLIPVHSISEHQFYTTRQNSIFKEIERLYLAWVKSLLGFDIDWNSGRKL